MESSLRYLWVLFACLFLQVRAECKSYGVDFSNGGTYQIDGSSNQYFSFITVFQGKTDMWMLKLRQKSYPFTNTTLLGCKIGRAHV